jgi:hypothetical protein
LLKIRGRQGATGALIGVSHAQYSDFIKGPADYLE